LRKKTINLAYICDSDMVHLMISIFDMRATQVKQGAPTRRWSCTQRPSEWQW